MSRIVESLYRAVLNEGRWMNSKIPPDQAFDMFLVGTNSVSTGKSPKKTDSLPQYYMQQEIDYEFEAYDGTINIFKVYKYPDAFTYNASYNGKWLTDLFRFNGYTVQETIEFFNRALKLEDNTNEINNMGGLAAKMDMVDKDTFRYGIHGDFARYRMSYGNGFKYKDIFKRDPRLAGYARYINKTYGLDGFFRNDPNDPNIRVNGVWRNIDDPDILLVSVTGYHVLTTEERFISDLEEFERKALEKV